MQAVFIINLLVDAVGATLSVTSVADGRFPFMPPGAVPPDFLVGIWRQISWGQAFIFRRVPLQREQRIDRHQAIFIIDFLIGTVGATLPVVSVADGRFPFMTSGTLPPDLFIGTRRDIFGHQFTIQGRMPLSGQ